MDAMNSVSNAGASSKAPASSENGPSLGGFVAQQKMEVQPPRREDLQGTYATTVDDVANPKGWYGSMSTIPILR